MSLDSADMARLEELAERAHAGELGGIAATEEQLRRAQADWPQLQRGDSGLVSSYMDRAEERRDPAALGALGVLALRCNRPDVAGPLLEVASDRCRHAFFALNDGLARLQNRDIQGARAALNRADRLRPDDPAIVEHLAAVSGLCGGAHTRGARVLWKRALALTPQSARVANGYAGALLKTGEYGDGWRYLEARRHLPHSRAVLAPPPNLPEWQGQDVSGRTLLVIAEQGLGDVCLLARYLPLLRERGARVILAVHPPLRRLMVASDVADAVLEQDEPAPADVDFWTLMFSLPLRFGTTPETIPPAACLQPPADVRDTWRERITNKAPARLRVGLTWVGGVSGTGPAAHGGIPVAALRNVPLAALEPLGSVDGVRFFGLQKGAAEDDQAPPGLDSLVRLGPQVGDVADTAAALLALDAVVTADTLTANLAGAVGVPALVLLSTGCDWRWGAEGESTPWYPDAQLVRQSTPGEWGPVVIRVVDRLHELASEREKAAA